MVPGFWNYEDDEELGPDEVFKNDDLPRKGHQELHLKQEIRQYARYMVWELPLLSKLAKPFTPPAAEQLLRFRYTTYMGEKHPSESKVVVDFSPSKVPDLTSIQRSKLIKLAGARYNPSTDIIKISCESFDTAAQNKRYLGDLVEQLLTHARDPTDTFEDVPFDFRHHNAKPFHEFPEEWKLTPDRASELAQRRAVHRELADVQPPIDGRLYIPGGPEQRAAEAEKAEHVEREQMAVMEPARFTEREREMLAIRSGARENVDKMMTVLDRKARRATRRDIYVKKAVAMAQRKEAAKAAEAAREIVV
ncbi:hypothetical protein BT63DRAFT_366832 [Microthyrium microscopicum]|uniref:Small ribosomal subunit protein mS35 mitochondrial conserved domain-containing protein n=1 Tax=Microthyrium microscopicum TaxID=703497 RepID=A0A6A6UTC6_9PEZI|nr:hypothetical protein BT63DRAFT_366832 [Microthyrium microscopicum]